MTIMLYYAMLCRAMPCCPPTRLQLYDPLGTVVLSFFALHGRQVWVRLVEGVAAVVVSVVAVGLALVTVDPVRRWNTQRVVRVSSRVFH